MISQSQRRNQRNLKKKIQRIRHWYQSITKYLPDPSGFDGSLNWQNGNRRLTIKRVIRREPFFILGAWHKTEAYWMIDYNESEILNQQEPEHSEVAKFLAAWHDGKSVNEINKKYRDILRENRAKEIIDYETNVNG